MDVSLPYKELPLRTSFQTAAARIVFDCRMPNDPAMVVVRMKMSDEEQRFQQELEERAKTGDKAAAAVLKIRTERLGRIRTGKAIVRLIGFCILCVIGWVLYWIFG